MTKSNKVSYYLRAAGRFNWPKIRALIASVPRCGSTFLMRSLAGLPPGSTCPKESDCAFVRDLGSLPLKRFLKTHALAPDRLPEDVRAIFLFGDPVCAVISTWEKRFDRNHFLNCGYTAAEPPSIYERDDLGYEAIFDSWMTPHSYPVLALRYEAMFDHQQAISEFLGIPVKLPPQRPRTTNISPELGQRLQRVYSSLYRKVAMAPDVSVIVS